MNTDKNRKELGQGGWNHGTHEIHEKENRKGWEAMGGGGPDGFNHEWTRQDTNESLRGRIEVRPTLGGLGFRAGDGFAGDDVLQYLVVGDFFGLGLVGEADAVAEDIEEDFLHVLGGD